MIFPMCLVILGVPLCNDEVAVKKVAMDRVEDNCPELLAIITAERDGDAGIATVF